MIEEPVVKRKQRLLRLRLGDHVIQTFSSSEVATLRSAVSLLRTLFEDHFVDPVHQSCLFFSGCTIGSSQDFNVTHRDERVILSDFTFPHKGPTHVSLPLSIYTKAVVSFSEEVMAMGIPERALPAWQQQYVQTHWTYLTELTALGRSFLNGDCTSYQEYCDTFYSIHGRLKRALEIQVLSVPEPAVPWHPVRVEGRMLFGPIRKGQVLAMRLNGGDLTRVTVNQFIHTGVHLTLEGVGSGGVCPGDMLLGIQLFYP